MWEKNTMLWMRTDEEYIDDYRKGDEAAFAVLVERHLKAVYGFALRFVGERSDAEDVVQESFLKAWKHIRSFNVQRGRYKTWLMSIVRNVAIDHLRKRKNITFSQMDEDANFAETLSDESPLPDEIVARKEDIKELENALSQISLPNREILLLYNGNDFSFEEIASIQDTPVNTVKSRYHRAVAALREVLVHPKGPEPRI